MAYDFSKGSKTIRKVGFLDGVNGSKIRPVSPFPLESSKGLVAKYFDSTKGSLSATRLLDQSPLNSGTRRTGEEGRCYLYDGVDDYSALDAGLVLTGDFTLSWRMRFTTGGSATFIYYGSGSGNIFANLTTISLVIGGPLYSITYNQSLSNGIDYHFLIKRESGVITLYINGIAQTDTETTTNTLTLNRISHSTSPFNGRMWDIRCYNKALTQDEVNFVKSFGETGTDPSLPVNWWKCDEQSGTIGYDSVGGNHLTHTNITAATFHATQNIWSFQNQVGYNTAKYFPSPETGYYSAGNVTLGANATWKAELYMMIPNYINYIIPFGNNVWTQGFGVIFYATGRVRAWSKGGAAYGPLLTNVNGNEWFTVSYGYDGTDIYVDINGARVWAETLLPDQSISLSNVPLSLGGGSNLTNNPCYIKSAKLWINNSLIRYYDSALSDFTIDQTGNQNLTLNGSISNNFLPRDESDPTNDVLGNPLTNIGRRPNDASLHSSNCLTADGTLYIAAAHLAGTETVVSSGGTSTPSISAGRIDFTAGTCWDLTLSDGTHYPLSEGGGIGIHDDSGSENHGILTNATLASAWGGSQDSYHKNLSDGFVYAYQPAKQVFTGAQAANITGISFKFRSTDKLVVFNDAPGAAYLLAAESIGSSPSIYLYTGTPVITIDGETYAGANRGDLYNAICDGELHEIVISGISFSSVWLTNGIYINSYGGTWDWNSTTYLWDLQATDSNGDPIYPADPDVRLPAVTSSLGPYSIPLTDLPSDPYHNRAETLIDLDPDSTPEMSNIYLESVFNGSTSNGYVTNDSVLNFTDNLTVSCWAKSDLTDITSSADTLVSMYEDTGDLEVWRMEISTDEKLRFQVGNSGGTGATIETADSAYPIDTWTHYAATFDGGVVKLYVNGELQSSSESSAHATSLNGRSSPLVLGAYYWSGGGGSFQEWDGALRNIRVYKGDSAPLSNSQIVRDMMEAASQPRFEGQTVIVSYDLVKDTLDRSGNSLNAQNNNISFTKKTVPASLDLGTDLGEDGIVQKTVKFDSGEWGAVFDGSSYMIVKNREKLKIKEKPFSIECSVKTTDTGSNTILSKYQTSGNLRSYSLNIESGKIVFHSSSNGTAVVSSTGSDTINDGSWHKIKVVRESESGTSLKMYVDDVEDTGVGGSLASNFSENISNVAIGAYNTDATAANVFTGNIRELKVFTDDNIERASWELAKDTRDSSSNNYHGENNGITFLTPKQEYGYTVSDSTPLAKQDQYLKEYHKSRLYL